MGEWTVKVEKEWEWEQVEEKQEAFHLCSVFLFSCKWEILVSSGGLLVSEMFVGGCSGSEGGLCPPPDPFPSKSILLPFLKLQSGIPLYAKGISSCLPMSGSDMGHRTIVLWRLCFPNKPGREKHWQFEWACLCLHWNMELFMLIEWGGLCTCVFDIELSLVGSGHAWIRPSCSPVFLHCPESTVICPP